jgi:hypothetical protein
LREPVEEIVEPDPVELGRLRFLHGDSDSPKDDVDGVACLIVAVGPEMAVGVEGFHRRLVAEPSLHCLD